MTRTGQLELVFGTNAALERAGEEWTRTARYKLAQFCRAGITFSAEDLVAAVGLPPGSSHNAVGGIFRQAAHEGWIVEAGSRRSSRPDRHGGLVRTWRSAS